MKRLVAVALVSVMLVSGLLSVLPGIGTSPALAAGRAVTVATTYPSITTGKGKEITFPIQIINKGSVDEWLKLEITSSPDGWNSTLKAGGLLVREVFVLADKTQEISLITTPPATTPPGDYTVTLRATSSDGQVVSSLDIKVGISQNVNTGIKLSTDYPKLQGAPGGSFQFKVDILNQSADDRDVSLTGVAPNGWTVNFQPAYESKQISSLSVKAGSTQGVNVDVTASAAATPGTFPITISAASGSDKDAVELSVTLSGTGKLTLASATGRLNVESNAGSDTVYTMNVLNSGTADMQNVTFISSPPEGWTVSFEPAKIAELKVGTPQQVNVHITPSAKAIAGDYALAIRASSADVMADQEVRVTVTTSGAWGFVGLFVVAIVVVGMVGIYTKLGRR